VIEIGSGENLKTFVVDRSTYEVSHRANQNEPTAFVKDGVQHLQFFDKLEKHEVVALSNLSIQAEKYYYFPKLIEWAKDGERFYILNINSQPFYVKN
jgi:phosphoenolpyruvate synthase/pyruvate phosphate dikinase